VVVFQSDIRRALMRVGSSAWFDGARSEDQRAIDEVVEAATILARHRTGAIIAFEQDANLDEFVGTNKGRVLDAAVSRDLLVTLFVPEGMNKLHDGAVILRGRRIAKAGVFFPMPDGKVLDESFGSRHRAALGITEETDAIVIVVSEERGSISFCFNGNIISDLDGTKLRAALDGVFAPKGLAKRRDSMFATVWGSVRALAAPRLLRGKVREQIESSPSTVSREIVRLRTSPRADAPASANDAPASVSGEPPAPLRKRPKAGQASSVTTSGPESTTGPVSTGQPKRPEKLSPPPLAESSSDSERSEPS
jgi:diadenylate cyclase